MSTLDEPNTELKSKEIKPIDLKSVHQICSGQVILSLAVAIKELVENSLDAGATSIEIHLKESGRELIEVVDNGSGIVESNFEEIGTKHSTSKLEEFSDLTSLNTFGFRGEALSSLCSLSDVTIVTCHKCSSTGFRLQFDHNGILIKKIPSARSVGTSVLLHNLFAPLPVRHKEFVKNIKRELNKMVQLLTAYCLISTNVKFNCLNIVSRKKTVLVTTEGSPSMKVNITNIFGVKQIQSLMEFKHFNITKNIQEEFNIESQVTVVNCPFRFQGYVSTCEHGHGRSSADRQFLFINKRPCDLTKVIKVINEVYHSFNRHQYPFVCLDISLNKDLVDVNVTPDKRQIYVQHERVLLASLKASLLQMYEHIPSRMNSSPAFSTSVSSFKNTENYTSLKRKSSPNLNLLAKRVSRDPPYEETPEDSTTLESDNKNLKSLPTTSQLSPLSLVDKLKILRRPDNQEISPKMPKTCTTSLLKFFSRLEPGNANEKLASASSASAETIELSEEESSELDISMCSKESDFVPNETSESEIREFPSCSDVEQSELCEPGVKVPTKTPPLPLEVLTIEQNEEPDEPSLQNSSLSSHHEVDNCDEPIADTDCQITEKVDDELSVTFDSAQADGGKKCITIDFSMESIATQKKGQKKDSQYRRFKAAISPMDNHSAEEELTRELSKDKFAEMEIIGQFNLGFIIAKLGPDLFIIDQHASDEKYNFETLQKTTIMDRQKLVVPQNLELTAVNESIILDNLEIFRKNGFEFIITESAPTGQRIQLSKVPISKNWTFGKEDVDELIFMLSDSQGTMCRPSKLNQMLASRACRKSVMIGSPLTERAMKKLVTHMGEIEQPWNCPHGRPTIRHLINLDMCGRIKQ